MRVFFLLSFSPSFSRCNFQKLIYQSKTESFDTRLYHNRSKPHSVSIIYLVCVKLKNVKNKRQPEKPELSTYLNCVKTEKQTQSRTNEQAHFFFFDWITLITRQNEMKQASTNFLHDVLFAHSIDSSGFSCFMHTAFRQSAHTNTHACTNAGTRIADSQQIGLNFSLFILFISYIWKLIYCTHLDLSEFSRSFGRTNVAHFQMIYEYRWHA